MEKKVIQATKWSVISEVVAKVISPITTMLLARVLSTEVFGIVASITVITSMADMLTDAGFNAYILQHKFKDEAEEKETVHVCFWSNITISMVIFLIIVLFRESFSAFVGASGYSTALIIASLVLPLTSVSSVSITVLRKQLNFKKVGAIRVASKFVPLLITYPLALLGCEYWSLIIGTIVGEILNVILCLCFGAYRSKLFYKFNILKNVLNFSLWAFLETILEWLLANIAIMTISNVFGLASLGLFKTSMTLISQITTSVYSLYSNVYKSTMARSQNDEEAFSSYFKTFQGIASVIMIPLGIGVVLMRDFVTYFMLGSEWMEASAIIGMWGCVSIISISFGNFYSDAIRAKGYPKVLVVVDAIYLVFIIVLLVFAKILGFEGFCVVYCGLKLLQPILQIVFGQRICRVKFGDILKNDAAQIFASALMTIPIYIAMNSLNYRYDSVFLNIMLVLICIIVYIVFFYIATPYRKRLTEYIIGKIRK